MPISNLSKVFGPTIVGYSSANPEEAMFFKETGQQNMVMEKLINLPDDYWISVLAPASNCLETHRFKGTPSNDYRCTSNPVIGIAASRQGIFFAPPDYKM